MVVWRTKLLFMLAVWKCDYRSDVCAQNGVLS